MANMAQSIRLALHYGEEHLEVKDIFGQDVGMPLGGVFTATQGLKTSWNSPLDERGIVGAATGIALTGQRCVAEIQFCDYIFNTIDLLKMVGNTHWVSHGNYSLPLVLMTPVGAGIHGSIYHSHSFDAMASRLVGWKVVMPSTPYDAYGLMLSAIKDPNPVMFLKPKALLRVRSSEDEWIPGVPKSREELNGMIDAPLGEKRNKWKPRWPELEEILVPIGKAKVVHTGSDVTVVSYGRQLPMCETVSHQLKKESGIEMEVIDLRSIFPYDWESLKKSIQKTKRVLFVNEDTEVTNFAEHLAYRCTQELFYHLHAPPRVLAGKNLPGIGLHQDLEKKSVPQVEDIRREVLELLKEQP